MTTENQTEVPLDPQQYIFWTPEPGRTLEVGAERQALPLPQLPLPLHREDMEEAPTTDAIGRGVYDYLRRFPDCPGNTRYAELLRDAFPHYIADLGAQIVMLDHKEVDSPYVRRKLAALKILALLQPDNPGLLQQIGMVDLELGLMFTELGGARRYLLEAMGFLQRSLDLQPANPSCLNQLGQIDFLLGDYPSALRRWQLVAGMLEEGPPRRALCNKVARLAGGEAPDHPLIDDLEAIGEALELYGSGDVRHAGLILERLEEEGSVQKEFPSPEFYYLLGMCRGRSGDPGGAFAAFDRALDLDPDYSPAIEGKNRILGEGRL